MSKIKKNYPEIENIQEDLSSLKENTYQLAQHVKADGTKQAAAVAEKAHEAYDGMKAQGWHEFEKIEKRVRDKPGQSLALAFVAGLFASYLLGRR